MRLISGTSSCLGVADLNEEENGVASLLARGSLQYHWVKRP